MQDDGTIEVLAPLLNPNEEAVTLAEWTKASRSRIHKGEVIAILETSKATFQIEAEAEGYLIPLYERGQSVPVGKAIAVIAQTADAPSPAIGSAGDPNSTEPVPGAASWSRKAELLARRHGVGIHELARTIGRRVTEQDVTDFLTGSPPQAGALAASQSQELAIAAVSDLVDDLYPARRQQRLLLLGGGVGAAQILDVISRSPNQRAVGILDDAPTMRGKTVMGCPIVGTLAVIQALWRERRFDALVITVSSARRIALFEEFRELQIPFANIIDSSARILSNAAMGEGNVLMGNVQLGACSQIGHNNFLSANVNLEHHNVLGNHCRFGPGVMTSGEVRIGSRVIFGTGIFIEPGLSIGDDAVVASGVVLTCDIPTGSRVKAIGNFRIGRD